MNIGVGKEKETIKHIIVKKLKRNIKSLREEGFKNKEISQKLNIVQKTLERHITYMKKNGLL